MDLADIDPNELNGRAARGQFDADVRAWLQRGCAAYERGRGAVQMGACLRLAGSTRSWNAARRNAWISEVARLIGMPNGPTPCSERLEQIWNDFYESREWVLWRLQLDPPPEASELQAALFRVCWHDQDRTGEMGMRARALSARHIYRLLVGAPTVTFGGLHVSDTLAAVAYDESSETPTTMESP